MHIPLPLTAARFLELGDIFYTQHQAEPLTAPPHWVVTNPDLAADFGLSEHFFAQENVLNALSGCLKWDNPQPIASVYSGHQFGIWAGQLGDGRALLLGECTDRDGTCHEWQLKGAGKTRYSRFADGRAVLRSSIREYIASEAMHALGIPTSRALCLTGSAHSVYREREETAAVLTRTAPTFVRFGHFEHFYHKKQSDAVRKLADWLIRHFYPECAENAQPYAALFANICQKSAELVAAWQAVGFCHGVLNTDNMSVLGLTIDYGPYGFLDHFNRYHVCNHSDRHGRYAYYQQPYIVHWNLSRLGSCFQEMADIDLLSQILHDFVAQFQAAYQAKMRAKLGFRQPEKDDDELLRDLTSVLQVLHCDYTLFFRYLADLDSTHNAALPPKLADLLGEKAQETAFQHWLGFYRTRLRAEKRDPAERAAAMNAVNPLYIARNHLLQNAIELAQQGDFSAVQRLQSCLKNPFTEQADYADLALPPNDDVSVCVVSCSS